jgi:hypothetical protein
MLGTQPQAAQPQGPRQRQGQGQGSVWSSAIFRMLTLYFLISFFFKSKSTTTQPTTDISGKPLPPHDNLWIPSQRFDLKVYISEGFEFGEFDNVDKLLWHKEGLSYDWKDSNYVQQDFDLSLDTWPYKVLSSMIGCYNVVTESPIQSLRSITVVSF